MFSGTYAADPTAQPLHALALQRWKILRERPFGVWRTYANRWIVGESMRRCSILLCTLALLCQFSAKTLSVQTIIAPVRSIAWHGGVSGVIPNSSVVCSTLNPGATAAQINTAIANCPSGQVVKLNAGTCA